MYTYDWEKKELNLEKYVTWYFKYHIIPGNIMEYGYQDLDLRSKIWYQLNGFRYDKLSTAVAAVSMHQDK